ncbi:MAG TPA: ABC transporter permease [Stellaceae bacterium]|nr:ABC transporter permease [Stellaceae bacterium]
MLLYILRRLLATIPVVGLVAFFVFVLLYIAPGDPAAVIAGDLATADDIARIHQKLGLDQPFLQRFLTWLQALLAGDLGVSIFNGIPVATLILQRLGATLALTIASLLLTLSFAIPLGVIAAARVGTMTDRLAMLVALIGFSQPAFVLAYLLVFGFSIELRWLPVQGYAPLASGFWDFFRHLLLPATTLALIYGALIARITRASLLEVLSQDYIRTAHAKGLSSFRILTRHALKNAGIPIATVVGLGLAILIGGVIVTETVFSIPGLGGLTFDAILHRDYPVIQGVTLFFSLAYVLVNLMVDLSYTLFDPRVRL